MWRSVAAALVGAVALSAQAPIRPAPQIPPRDNRPPRPQTADTAPSIGLVRGLVTTDTQNSAAIARARVTLSGSSEVEPVVTDSMGRFEFDRVPAGHYTLSVMKTGYVTTRYGAKSQFEPPLPIDVTSGSVDDVEVRMPRSAAIVGRIVDELGDPIIGARVSANIVRVEGTEKKIEPVSTFPTETDDLGAYRVGGLARGRYLLSVTGPGSMNPTIAVSINGDAMGFGRRIGWGKTFYPAGNSAAAATPIDLSAGEERAGIDLTLTAFKPARLSVKFVLGAAEPAGMITTRLMFIAADAPEAGGTNQQMQFTGAANANVSAPTLSIDPGDWTIIVRRGSGVALAHITLAGGDDASLTLPIVPGARLTGRVVFEGPTRHPPPSSVAIDVVGAGSDNNISPLMLAPGGPFTPRPDGTFEIAGVIGNVELVVADPVGWALKSITSGNRDLLGAAMTFQGTESIPNLEIVLTDQVADLSGTVVDPESHPAAGCTVAMFPANTDAAFSSRRMRLATVNQLGHFVIDDVPAGAYLAVARVDINPIDWTSPASLDRLRVDATPITVVDREKKSVALTCTGR